MPGRVYLCPNSFCSLEAGGGHTTPLDLSLPFPQSPHLFHSSPSLPFPAVLQCQLEVFFDVSSQVKFWSSSFTSVISVPYAALVRPTLFFLCQRHVHPGHPPAMSSFVSHVFFRTFLNSLTFFLSFLFTFILIFSAEVFSAT